MYKYAGLSSFKRCHPFRADRFVLWYRALICISCQAYISRSLFRNLKTLAASSSSVAEDEGEYMELEGLPTPSTSQAPANDTVTSIPKKGPYSLHTKVAFWVFSFCFSDCCTLFCLFLFQEIGILSARGRMINWDVSLHLIVGELLFIIPLCSNLLLTYQSPIGKHLPCVTVTPELTRICREIISESIFTHKASSRVGSLCRLFVSFFDDTRT